MSKLMISSVLFATLAVGTIEGAENVATNKAARVAAQMQRVGGIVTKPASGKVVVLNAQTRVPVAKMQSRAKFLADTLTTEMVIEPCSGFSIETASELMTKAGADVAFFVIDDDCLPMSLVALEGGWAMINVAKLANDNPDDKTLSLRYSAELSRTIISLLAVNEHGCKPVRMADVKPAPRTGKDLDNLDSVAIPFDSAMMIHSNMPAFGIHPARKMPYKRACIEGWAPAPTNDIQKAIWEQVKAEANAKPSNPMKIVKPKK